LARRFDRSVRWVSGRLALVEVLTEAIQQMVREGKILAQVAMKFLGAGPQRDPRQSLEDCQRMARSSPSITAIRGKPATVWRLAQRLAGDPQAHSGRSRAVFQTQRQAQEKAPAGTGAERLRDLEMVMAIVNARSGGWRGALPWSWSTAIESCAASDDRIQSQLRRIDEAILRRRTTC